MNVSRIIGLGIGFMLFAGGPAFAQSSETTPPDQTGAGNEVVTRSELVTDLDRILSKWESQMENYATKDDVAELRELILQLREEMGGLGEREGRLRENVDGLEKRADHTGRPGF